MSEYILSSGHKASKYQSDIFDFIKNDTRSLIVTACAGSAKTTTIVDAAKYLKGKSVFLAFNKHIAEELKNKLPKGIKATTLHKLGAAIIMRNTAGQAKIDSDKLINIFNTFPDLVYNREEKNPERKIEIFNLRNNLEKLIGYIKNTLTNYENWQDVLNMVDQFCLDELLSERYDLIKKLLTPIINKSLDTKSFDFDDTIWLPVVLMMKPLTYDNILVDEAQDLNKCQIFLIEMLKKENTRYIIVGDPKQAVYSFRGSHPKAISEMREKFKAVELPLSICYRCPKSHVELAQTVVPSIEWFDQNDEGKIHVLNQQDFCSTVKKGDWVICRVNAPTVYYALKFVKKGQKVCIVGKDLKYTILSLVEKIKSDNLVEMMQKLVSYKEKEKEKLENRQASLTSIAALLDKCEMAEILIGESESFDDILNKIDLLFSSNEQKVDRESIIFSTIHRVKGMEADNIFIISPEILPLMRNDFKYDWQFQQENNCLYIALTRAKKNLYIVSNNKVSWWKQIMCKEEYGQETV